MNNPYSNHVPQQRAPNVFDIEGARQAGCAAVTPKASRLFDMKNF